MDFEQRENNRFVAVCQCKVHMSERTGDYTLVMRDGYAIRDWVPGEKRLRQVGVHGGVSREEMHVPLVGRASVLKRQAMRGSDVAYDCTNTGHAPEGREAS